MTVLSSQRYLNELTVEEKKLELSGADSVSIPCSYVGIIDGEEYAIIADGHHTLSAAKELGIKAIYNIQDDPERLRGDELLEARYIDSAYYNVETGIEEF